MTHTKDEAQPAQPEPNGWAISYDGKTPYAIWPEGDGPLLDLEVKRQGGTCCKLPIYTTPPAAHISPKQLLALAQEANLGLDKVIEVFRMAAQPAVQEPIGYAVPTFDFDNSVIKKVHYAGTVPLYTTPPAAQRQFVGLTDAEVMQTMSGDWTSQFYFARAIEAKLKEKNAVAQPSVPDALNPRDENPAYAAGWNDCRAAMMEMMK